MASTDLKDYLKLDYAVVLQRDEEGDWVAQIKELEGCIADGPTPDEAIQNLQSMKELWLTARLRSRRPIPLPAKELEEFSGKYLQRIPKSLHRKLVAAAEREGVSLNQFTTAVLAEAVGERAAKTVKRPHVSLVAFTGRDRWASGLGSEHGTWQTAKGPIPDRKRRNHSLRTLTNRTPEKELNPIGREPKNANEEKHATWNFT